MAQTVWVLESGFGSTTPITRGIYSTEAKARDCAWKETMALRVLGWKFKEVRDGVWKGTDGKGGRMEYYVTARPVTIDEYTERKTDDRSKH